MRHYEELPSNRNRPPVFSESVPVAKTIDFLDAPSLDDVGVSKSGFSRSIQTKRSRVVFVDTKNFFS